MRWRRRARPARPAHCMTPDCTGQAMGRRHLCRSCWYQIGGAFRLAIQEAIWARFWGVAYGLSRDAAAMLARRSGAVQDGPAT